MKSSLKRRSRIALLCCLPVVTGCDIFKKSSTGPSDTPKTVTLAAGSGYIFERAQTSTDDRDIWWNGVTIVPSTGVVSEVKMSFLGQPADLAGVTDLQIAAMTSQERVLHSGDAFAVEIRRPFDGQTRYALIRVASLATNVTLEFIYPR